MKKKDTEPSNIQDRKLNIIEKLIHLNDEDLVKQLEELIDTSFKRPHLKRFTKQELIDRARISNMNIEKGEVFTQEEAEKLSQSW